METSVATHLVKKDSILELALLVPLFYGTYPLEQNRETPSIVETGTASHDEMLANFQVDSVFILLQSAGSIPRKAVFAAGRIGNLLNTTVGSIRGAGLNRM